MNRQLNIKAVETGTEPYNDYWDTGVRDDNSRKVYFRNKPEEPLFKEGPVKVIFAGEKVKIKGRQYARPFVITPKWVGEGFLTPTLTKHLDQNTELTIRGTGKLTFTPENTT